MKRYRNIVALPVNGNESHIEEENIDDKFAFEDDIED